MGVATGCGCKEVYRFHRTTYPYSSCICSFLPTFCSFFYGFVLLRRRRKKEEECQIVIFYFARCIRKLRYYGDIIPYSNNNNNTQIAAIALPPSTTHPQLWAELLTFKPKCTIA